MKIEKSNLDVNYYFFTNKLIKEIERLRMKDISPIYCIPPLNSIVINLSKLKEMFKNIEVGEVGIMTIIISCISHEIMHLTLMSDIGKDASLKYDDLVTSHSSDFPESEKTIKKLCLRLLSTELKEDLIVKLSEDL